MKQNLSLLQNIKERLANGMVIPYLGAGVLALVPDCPVPDSQEKLATIMTEKVVVPHKIRKRLTAAAQFIENFKHRKTLVSLMQQSFSVSTPPSSLHRFLAARLNLPLIVDVWYDDAMQNSMAQRSNWGQVQGLSQSEHFGNWFGWYDAQGVVVDESVSDSWTTLLYKPIGSVAPANNYLVSDSDYVEVLTEIDIQTPIPPLVQSLRKGRNFLFLGCRFNDQLQRTFARQIIKRSSDQHWAVFSGELTRNEQRFFAEYNITHIDMVLEDFEKILTEETLLAV
ncbi:MAG: SIR2 family NAD-dependent protein deacylase [Burkholderiaceae bacterium]